MKKNFKKIICFAAIAVMLLSLVACGSKEDDAAFKTFPAFTAEDYSGQQYTESMFAESDATVVNFWYTGCQACVEEMPDLEKMSAELSEKNVKLIGLCADAGPNVEIDKEVLRILEKTGVTYPTLKITSGEKMVEMLNSVTAFPTTFVVDKNGNIIGEPIVGTINTESQEKVLNEKIDKAIAQGK